MTPPRSRATTTPAPETPPDPLAALRDAEPAGLQGAPVVADPGEGTAGGADQAHPLDALVRTTIAAVAVAAQAQPTGEEAVTVAAESADALLAILAASQPLAEPQSHEDAMAVVIAAWHADTVALGFLHKGGVCGCNYLARIALSAALPAAGE